jgi:hypothetical protein
LIAVGVLCLAGCGWRAGEEKVPLDDPGQTSEDIEALETAVEASEFGLPELVPDEEVVCVPDCTGRECGDDGCGGACGMCVPGVPCVAGKCECTPDCAVSECGPDGCGGSCGVCALGCGCVDGLCECVCEPDCWGKECGDDGCGGVCGTCLPGVPCIDALCSPCKPKCAGKQCGPDGCGGMCGECPNGGYCKIDGTCCVPKCLGKQCGQDGCGGQCGSCPPPGGDPNAVWCNDQTFQCEVPTTPDNGCKGIFECLNACSGMDQACQQACINDAPIDAQMQFNEVIQCLDNSGYFNCAGNDDECYQEAFEPCKEVYYQCVHGDMTCGEMYECIMSCPPTDQDCPNGCYSEGSVDALLTWDEFIGCLDDNGYFDCPDMDDACYQEAWGKCQAEFGKCVGPGGGG